MAKRRLSKQQKRRIADHQKNRIHSEAELDTSTALNARVISHHGRQLFAEIISPESTKSPERIKCKIRQNLGDIACGDYILVQQIAIPAKSITKAAEEKTEKQYVVVAVKPRRNLLKKTGFAGNIKPVAANIDQILVVTSLKPKPNPYLIDRYLTAAENLPATAIIVINKTDLRETDSTSGETQVNIDQLSRLYQEIGYRVICTSVKQAVGLDELSDILGHKTSILVGLSGVGKSSLVNAISPDTDIKVGEISKASGEGKHTTTVSALYHLKNNGIIIDSPGVRDFTPTNNSIEEITHGFVDVRKFSGLCKFSNCSHHHEPGCAMQQAVKDGLLAKQRLDSYLRLIDEFNEQ